LAPTGKNPSHARDDGVISARCVSFTTSFYSETARTAEVVDNNRERSFKRLLNKLVIAASESGDVAQQRFGACVPP